MTEGFKVISLKLIWFIPHPFESDIFCFLTLFCCFFLHIRIRARLVRRLIWVENLLCSNHNNPSKEKIKISFILLNTLIRQCTRYGKYYFYAKQMRKQVYKETTMDSQLYIKESYLLNLCTNKQKWTYKLLDKLSNKRSELKYLISFRKINQTRFYD